MGYLNYSITKGNKKYRIWADHFWDPRGNSSFYSEILNYTRGVSNTTTEDSNQNPEGSKTHPFEALKLTSDLKPY